MVLTQNFPGEIKKRLYKHQYVGVVIMNRILDFPDMKQEFYPHTGDFLFLNFFNDDLSTA
jgi:hypothetical protein